MSLDLLELSKLQPDLHMRQIRNIEFDHEDMRPLVDHEQNQLKLRSTCLNAFGAIVQKEYGPGTDFLIFSSWLGPLAQGSVENVRSVGSFEQHVAAACSQDITSQRYWCFPLCGGKPTHWVFSIFDSQTKMISIFNSIPKLASSNWAVPMTKDIIGRIRQVVALCDVEWDSEPWTDRIFNPPPSEEQRDVWSCGLFVMMAMQAFAQDGFDFSNCVNARIRDIRAQALRMMFDIPITRRTKADLDLKRRRSDLTLSGSEGVDKDVHMQDTRTEFSDAAPANDAQSASSELPDIHLTDRELSGTDSHSSSPGAGSSQNAVPTKKMKSYMSSDSDDSRDTDDEKVTTERSKAAHGPRKKKLSDGERHRILEDDTWTNSVEPHSVHCNGCHKKIKLHRQRTYDTQKWDAHKTKCERITGFAKKRVIATKLPKLLGSATDQSITSFFKPKVESAPPNLSIPIVASANMKRKYTVKTVKAAQTIISHLAEKVKPSKKMPVAPDHDVSHTRPTVPTAEPPLQKSCEGLTGDQYNEYILRTHTRSLGGVAPKLRARVARELFPYKVFPLRRSEKQEESADMAHSDDSDIDAHSSDDSDTIELGSAVPKDGDRRAPAKYWTASEHKRMDERLEAFARWEVNYDSREIRSSVCHRLTTNPTQICDACTGVAQDLSFKDAVHRKDRESKLPPEKQQEIHAKREKYSSFTIRGTEGRKLKTLFKDPLAIAVLRHLERDQTVDCFLTLYKHAVDGKLKGHRTFTEICAVFADRFRRLNHSNPNLKYGQRYPENYLNFMTLLRSYGQNSSRQYAIVTGQICGPSSRHLQSLVAKSEDALQNPALIFENMARVKRLVDAVGYSGPVAIAGDCTKVRPRLAYSTCLGAGYILGSTLPLEQCEIKNSSEIDGVVNTIKSSQAIASQVRAILAKIPLPQIPPTALALLPTTGKDDAQGIHDQHMQILKMAAQLKLPIISFSADGAASELAAQNMMDAERSDLSPLVYENAIYGIRIAAIIFPHTGPLVSITDPSHAMKTGRNQPQHGTHNGSFGNSYFVNNSLVELYETGAAGLQVSDVKNVDKQDDGAARRMFHYRALMATTYEEDGELQVHERFRGLFGYLLVFGELFDAWLNRKLDIRSRLIAAFRARFFLHIWRSHILVLAERYPDLYSTARSFISAPSFNIFNRLCDTLVALAIIYAKYYPDIPFCPWLLGTEYVEHFFGLARTMLPNFTYSQFISLVKHVMVRQRILLSGKFDEKKERTSRSGYVFDMDNSPLTREELGRACVQLTTAEIDTLVEVGHLEATSLAEGFLSMCAPPLPFRLSPLSGPLTMNKHATSVGVGDREIQELMGPATGEESDDEIDDLAPETEPDLAQWDLSETVAMAAADAARDSILNDALHADEAAVVDDSLEHVPAKIELSATETIISDLPSLSTFIVNGEVSLQKMLDTRQAHQSLTSVKSQRTVMLDPKLVQALTTAEDEINKAAETKLSAREASHRVRLAQDLDPDMRKPKTDRELHWQGTTAKRVTLLLGEDFVPNLAEKNVRIFNMLRRGCFVVMCSKTRQGGRFYIGEVLDLYKQGAGHRHGSIDAVDSTTGLSYLSLRVYLPLTHSRGEFRVGDIDARSKGTTKTAVIPAFSCVDDNFILFTHAKATHLLYNLGLRAFEGTAEQLRNGNYLQLNQSAASRWGALAQAKVRAILQD